MTQYAVCHIQRGNSNGSGLSTHIERQTKSGKPFIPKMPTRREHTLIVNYSLSPMG